MRSPPTHFVVFTTQRNGSTWFMSVLNGLDGVAAHGELFLPRRRSEEERWDSDFARPRYVEYQENSGGARPFSIFKYLDAFYRSKDATGFKLMYSQLRLFPELLPYLARKNIRVVHLVRRNHLDVLVSFAIKRQIDQAHVLINQDRPTGITVNIPVDSLLRDVRRLQFKHDFGRALLRVSRLRHVEITYEELVTNQLRFSDVLRFLDIPPSVELPASNIVKSRLGSQREVISNYDEVRRVLAGSRFTHLLE